MNTTPPRDPGRHSLPHLAPLEFPNQTLLLYVTTCVARRRPLLAYPERVALIQDAWRRADHWLVGRFIVMPDHLHFFCAPRQVPGTPLKRWMEFWRADVTRHWPDSEAKPIWQRDFFDRQLRSGESYTRKWQYVVRNAVVAQLAAQPEDWLWQGEMHVLPWHEAG